METQGQPIAEAMAAHIAACKKSGQTVAGYCQQHNLKVHQYYYWQKKLQPPFEGSFVKIAPVSAAVGVSIVFLSGRQVNFTMLPPVDYLKQLLQ